MKNRIYWLLLLCFVSFSTFSQTIPFQVFDGEGKSADIEQVMKSASQYEVVFFGELHNNSIAHWLQLRMLKILQQDATGRVVLSGEFFEWDDQLNIDEWFSGKITDRNFEAEAKLWNNYKTDYKPLMIFAKQNNIPFVASNIPRKYASLVSRSGLSALDSLSDQAKLYFPTLPIEVDMNLSTYQGMKDLMHRSSMNMDFMIEAQAVKDAAMAAALFPYLGKGHTLFHINGSYHTKKGEGIIWYLQKDFPETKILNIATVEQENVSALEEEYFGVADIIIVLPSDSPKSY